MTDKLLIEILKLSEKDWDALINAFYQLFKQFEEIAKSPPSPKEFIASIYLFGYFYMKNRRSMVKCYNVLKVVNELKKDLPSSSSSSKSD